MDNLPDSVRICNLENQEELNRRLFNRNIPSANLAPNFSFRPTATKYQLCPTNQDLEKSNTPIHTYPDFETNKVFYPGTHNAPVMGYLNNVNTESYLRNQFFALQECPQAAWVPDSTSELYAYNVDANIKPDNVLDQYPHLFKRYELGYHNPNPCGLSMGNKLYYNHTRNQLKDLDQ